MNENNQLMITYSGREFNLLKPSFEMFDIEDIAHSLSNINRFLGHTSQGFTVAQHCVNSYRLCKNYKKEALFHDASEAYLGDIPTPIKNTYAFYRELEDKIMNIISQKFNFEWPEPFEVKDIDKKLFLWESYHLFPSMKIQEIQKFNIKFEIWDSKRSKKEFLKCYELSC